MRTQKVKILDGVVTLTITTPTVRSDQKTTRIIRQLVASGVLDITANVNEYRVEWNFATLIGRLVAMEFDKKAFKASEDIQYLAKWYELFLNVDFTSRESVYTLYDKYLDLHEDIPTQWRKADESVYRDVFTGKSEALPEEDLEPQEAATLADQDSPLAVGAKSIDVA